MTDEQTPPTPPPPHESAPPPPPPPSPPPVQPGGASDNRQLMLVLSYLWIFALIPYLTEKNDAEVKWHSRHGLVLTAAELVINLVFAVLFQIPAIGCLFAIVWPLAALLFVGVHVVCLVKALNGERFLIPGISQYADQLP